MGQANLREVESVFTNKRFSSLKTDQNWEVA